MALLRRLAQSRPLLAGIVVIMLAAIACLGWWIGDRAMRSDVTARPALWRISQGDRAAYLFGTIHAVPRRERWLSPVIVNAAGRSDILILEVTGLDRERESRAIFERLGRSPGLPDIAKRLDALDADRFRALERARPADLHGLSRYESWAAALLVNASAASGLSLSAGDAGEAVLGDMFARMGKHVDSLETIEGQLGLFDHLPEADQRLLLAQAVREAGEAPRLYRALHDAWSRGDVHALERQFLAPLARSPTLRRVLIEERNRQWSDAIDRRLRSRPDVLFIAVGAGHLLGPDGVPARLGRRGWRIDRLQ